MRNINDHNWSMIDLTSFFFVQNNKEVLEKKITFSRTKQKSFLCYASTQMWPYSTTRSVFHFHHHHTSTETKRPYNVNKLLSEWMMAAVEMTITATDLSGQPARQLSDSPACRQVRAPRSENLAQEKGRSWDTQQHARWEVMMAVRPTTKTAT